MVTTFLDNFDKSSVNDVYADMYFTMYINQVPYQLESDGYYIKQLTLEEAEHMVKKNPIMTICMYHLYTSY